MSYFFLIVVTHFLLNGKLIWLAVLQLLWGIRLIAQQKKNQVLHHSHLVDSNQNLHCFWSNPRSPHNPEQVSEQGIYDLHVAI